MGCDIHAIFQRIDGDRWVDVPTEWGQHRDYFLFSVLAGVRSVDGWPRPISSPRGAPLGLDIQFQGNEMYHGRHYLGTYGLSWLTAQEMLDWHASHPDESKDDDGDDALAYFFDEVKRLVDLHGTIRMVFGFDN